VRNTPTAERTPYPTATVAPPFSIAVRVAESDSLASTYPAATRTTGGSAYISGDDTNPTPVEEPPTETPTSPPWAL